MHLSLHPVALINVSDHISRGSANNIGVLLGNVSDSVTVNDSYEIALSDSSVDLSYLANRNEQFQTIAPQRRMVGMYFLNNSLEMSPYMRAVKDQVHQFKRSVDNGPFVVIVFDSNAAGKSQGKLFQAYIDEEPVRTIICPGESEIVATNTIHNNKIYSEDSDITVHQEMLTTYAEGLDSSVRKLGEKIARILEHLDHPNQNNIEEQIYTNNLIVHLTKKLKALKQNEPENTSSGFAATQLALLAKQLMLIEKIKTSVYKKLLQSTLSGFEEDI